MSKQRSERNAPQQRGGSAQGKKGTRANGAAQRPSQPQTTAPSPARINTGSAQSAKSGQAARTAQEIQEARAQRKAVAQQAAAQRKRMRMVRNAGIAIALLIIFGGIAVAMYIREANKPGEHIAMQASNPHLTNATDAHPPYTTDPPTSGPHIGQVPNWIVYTEPITKEVQVHGLEDGGVVINYRPDLNQETVKRLSDLTNAYINRPEPKNHVLMAPYPGLSNPIVLTAWQRIDRIDVYDEARIRRFVDEYVGVDHHQESDSGPRWR